MANKDIKRAIGGRGLTQWQVADALGISEATFYRKMRKELPEDEKQKILAVIEAMGEGE